MEGRAGAGAKWDARNNGGLMSAASDDILQPPSDAAIFDRIVAAVMEQRLAAGAKLPEAALCEAFDCSRSQIRRVLVVLAERGVVALHPNRGAFVAKPSADEARDVFEARRAIERSIVLTAAGRIDANALSELRANARAGGVAENAGDCNEFDPAVRPVSSSPRRGRRQRPADAVSGRPRHAHLPHHRPLRLAQRPFLLRSPSTTRSSTRSPAATGPARRR